MIDDGISELSKRQILLKDLDLKSSISKSKIETSKLLIDELKNAEIQNSKKLNNLYTQVKLFKKLPDIQTEELKLRNLFEDYKNTFENALSDEKQIKTQEDYRIKRLDA